MWQCENGKKITSQRTSIISIPIDLTIGSNTKHDEAQQSREGELGQEGLEEVEAGSNFDGGEGAADDTAKQGAEKAADNLEDPVDEHFMEGDVASAKDGERDGGVVMSAGDGPAEVDEGDKNEAYRERGGDKAARNGDLDRQDEHGRAQKLHHGLAEAETKLFESHFRGEFGGETGLGWLDVM